MEVLSNTIRLWRGAVEPAEVDASGNEVQAWKGAVEPAKLLIARGGGVRFFREPDQEIREKKKIQLKALIKQEMVPKPSAIASDSPQETLLIQVQAVTAGMPRGQQRRTERLLAQTGISMRELLILLK